MVNNSITSTLINQMKIKVKAMILIHIWLIIMWQYDIVICNTLITKLDQNRLCDIEKQIIIQKLMKYHITIKLGIYTPTNT